MDVRIETYPCDCMKRIKEELLDGRPGYVECEIQNLFDKVLFIPFLVHVDGKKKAEKISGKAEYCPFCGRHIEPDILEGKGHE